MIVVWAGKLRELWDSVRELRSSVCERRLERTVLRPALLPVKTAQFTQFSFRYDVTQYNRSVYDMIYFLTAVGSPTGGSSTVHIYTQTVHRTAQLILEQCGPCHALPVIPWHLLYN